MAARGILDGEVTPVDEQAAREMIRAMQRLPEDVQAQMLMALTSGASGAPVEAPKPKRTRARTPGSIEQLPSGKWRARLEADGDPRTLERKRPSKTFSTQKAAQAWLTEEQKKRQDGLLSPSGKRTLGEHIEAWLETVVLVEQREACYVQYKRVLRCYVTRHIGHLRLSSLKPDTMQAHYAFLLGRNLSAASAKYVFRVLKQCLEQAVEWGYLPRNPVKLKRASSPKVERPTIPPDKMRQFLDEVSATAHGCLLVVALVGGLRPGEQQALMWPDIDWTRNSITVRRAVEDIPGDPDRGTKRRREMKEPKTEAGWRTVVMPPFVMDMLRRHRVQQAEQRLRAGSLWANMDLVFTNDYGGLFDRTAIKLRVVRPILKRIGLPATITYRDIRHAMPTLLIAEKVSPKVVSERMGHSSVQITLATYTHNSPGMQQEAADVLDSLLNPPENPLGPPAAHEAEDAS